MVCVVVTLLSALVGTACGGDTPRGPGRAPVAEGAPAPAYAAVTIDGDSMSLDDLRGRVVLLNIWATWCHPCREELPLLQALHERHAADGLELIGVSVDARGEGDAVRAFARRFGVTYPIWLDPDERASSTFLAIGVPASYLIDRTGTLVWKKIGPIQPNDSVLAQRLETALGRQ